MIVVSNTSPLNYLARIDLTDLLPALFGEVAVPEAVLRELQSPAAPAKIATWLASSPPWLRTHIVTDVPDDLRSLGAGEREAIALALPDGLVLLDERKARRRARQLGLSVAGTLGVLDAAARRGLVDHASALRRLGQTSFRASPELLRPSR